MKNNVQTKTMSLLLCLAMLLSLVPAASLTAFAAGEKAYAAYDVTTETNKTKSGDALTALQVTFNERKWYIIEDNSSSATSGTVTLLSADTTFGTKSFDNNENSSNKYSTSQVKAYLDSMTGTDGAFADVAKAIETVNLTTNKYDSTYDTTDVYETVNGVKLYLLSVEEADSLPENVRKAGFTGGDCEFNEWWLRSPSYSDTSDSDAAYVWGDDGGVVADGASVNYLFGVRPALQLDLSKVEFDSSSKTFAMAKSAYADYLPVAADDATALAAKVVKFNGMDWYLIEDNSTSATEGTVTLLAKECVGASAFNSIPSNTYSGSTVETYVNNWYTSNISADAKAAVNGNGMFLLTKDQANALCSDVLKCSQASGAAGNYWWLCSPGIVDYTLACVDGENGNMTYGGDDVNDVFGVRPALKLDLSKVEFDSETFAVVKSAYADYLPAATDDATALAAKVVKFNGYNWYIIEDNSKSATEGTVTLLAADDGFGLSKFSDSYSNAYSSSKIKAALDAMTVEDGDFANVASAIVSTALEDVIVPRAKLYLLSTSEAQNLNQTILNYDFPDSASKGAWWLRSPGTNSDYASCVYGDEGRVDGTGYNIREACGVRPALKLDLSKAEFDSETKTFAVPNSSAYAGYVPAEADDATALAAKVVKFNGHDWYLIEDNSRSKTKGTVTLLAADTSFGTSQFNSTDLDNKYSTSTVKTYLDGMTETGGAFADVADAISEFTLADEMLSNVKLYLLGYSEAVKLPAALFTPEIGYWLRTHSSNNYDYAHYFICDPYGVKIFGADPISEEYHICPALKLDLSKVEFDSETKTFAVPTPGAYADYVPAEADNATALAAKVVKFNGYYWYLIKDNSTSETEGTVTLFAKDPIGNSKFHDSSDKYSESVVKEYLDNLTNAEGSFAGVADAIKTVETLTTKGYNSDDVYDTVSNVKLYLLSTSEAYKLPVNIRKCGLSGYWWLRSPGKRIDNDDFDIHSASAALVDGYDYNNGEVYEEEGLVQWELGVRPALKLDLSQVTFASVSLSGGANAAISGGTATQNYFDKGNTRGAMTAVTYTADANYEFPKTSELYKQTNGITVTRTSDTVITVSGTPTETVTSISVPDAVLAHTHSFTYSASGATITATCSANGCDLPNNQITFTLVAPAAGDSELVYDGTDKLATLTGAEAFNAATGMNVSANDIVYNYKATSKDSAVVVTETKNAGIYQALYTLQSDFPRPVVGISFMVSKADQTTPAAPTEASKTVNSVTLNTIANGEYKCNDGDWQASPTFTGLAQNTSYTFRQRVAADGNHNASAGSFGATIKTNDHAHSFTYSANGATLTATCSGAGTCNLSQNKASLTLAAPTLTVYGGTGDSAATLTGLDAFNTATGKTIAATDIKYVGRDGTTYAESATAPTGAGKYTAKITVEEKTATVNYEISKANPSYTAPEGLNAAYGDLLSSVTLPEGWAWVNGAQTVGNVGNNSFTATFTPADTANYNEVSGVGLTVTVDKQTGKAAVISTDFMSYSDDSIYIEGVAGQEYFIVTKGTNVTAESWQKSVLPEAENDNWVFFEGLTPATEYEIYTRTAETETSYASDAVKANVYTTLSGIGWNYDSELVGATITIEPEPETQGLTYKWYHDEVTVDEYEIEHHSLTEIPGFTDPSYTFRTEDVGKHIAVKIFAGDSEVGDVTTLDPVAAAGKVIFDSMGGSEIETLTGVIYQSTIEAPEKPTYVGYTFDGWYWEDTYDTPFDFENDRITWTETTLYAKWLPNAPTGLTAVYGDILLNVALPEGWSWADGTQSVGDVGTKIFKANFYDITNDTTYYGIDVTVTVVKAAPAYIRPSGLTADLGNKLSDVILPAGWAWSDPEQVIDKSGVQTYPAIYVPEDTVSYGAVENIHLTVTVKEIRFVDVEAGSYYCDAVYWAVAHGITVGTTATTFSPNESCTREQAVTFLWRMAGSPEPTIKDCPFTDLNPEAYYYKAVLWATENGITSGTTATTFSPSDICTREQIVTFLWRLAGSPEPETSECAFEDANPGYSYKAILWAAENGITTGTSETTFSPEDICTRAQIVTLLYRYSNE